MSFYVGSLRPRVYFEGYLLLCGLTEIEHRVLEQRVFSIVDDRSTFVKAFLLSFHRFLRLSPFVLNLIISVMLARAQVALVFVLIRGRTRLANRVNSMLS